MSIGDFEQDVLDSLSADDPGRIVDDADRDHLQAAGRPALLPVATSFSWFAGDIELQTSGRRFYG